MRQLLLIVTAGSALAVAGVAVGKGIEVQSVKQVSATFTATSVTNSSTRTCTNSDGTFAITRAEYTGIATSSEPTLSGQIRLNVQSLINTTKNLGTLSGKLRIDTASSRDTTARLDAIFANGQVHGLASGRVKDPSASLLGDVSAGFTAAGGFTNGKLGGTDAGGAAVQLLRGACRSTQSQASQRIRARGSVTAVSATSITVAGVTCAVPSRLAERVSKLKAGDVAEIRCELLNNQQTLTRVSRTGKGKGKDEDDDD